MPLHRFEFTSRIEHLQQSVYRNQNDVITAIQSRFTQPALGLSWTYNPQKKIDIQTHLTYNNRAPSINESYANGLHHGLAIYEKGNTNLQQEQALRGLVQFHASTKYFEFTGQSFVQKINDFIYASPLAQPILTIRGAFPVTAYNQMDARFFGNYFKMATTITNRLQIVFSAQMIRARIMATRQTPAYTPADQYRTSIRYNVLQSSNQKIALEWKTTYHQKQWRFSTENDLLATPHSALVHDLYVYCTSTVHQTQIEWGIGIENTFNTSYRLYTDRMRYYHDALGRNIHVNLNIPIKSFQK